MEKKHYYRYKGFIDGSGIPDGLIVKYLSEEDVARRTDHVYEIIPESKSIFEVFTCFSNWHSIMDGPIVRIYKM